MIKYALRCQNGHGFEAWFRSSDTYERQARRHLVECPECGDKGIERQPMAPAVHAGRKSGQPSQVTAPAPLATYSRPPVELLRALKQHVIANSEDVGARFANEARAMHEGEIKPRAIRGETSPADAMGLAADGVPFGVLPVLPEEHN